MVVEHKGNVSLLLMYIMFIINQVHLTQMPSSKSTLVTMQCILIFIIQLYSQPRGRKITSQGLLNKSTVLWNKELVQNQSLTEINKVTSWIS